MSELEVLIPITFFLFMFFILSKMMKYRHERKRWEMMKRQEDAGQSLTTSELQLMIEDAVARATAPFEDRLTALERPLLEVGRNEEPVEKTLGRENVR